MTPSRPAEPALARRAVLLVAALALVVYLNVLPNGFVIDDQVLIVGNHLLREPGGLKRIFATNAWAALAEALPVNFYRPLMHLTLWVWWRMFQDNPAGYHLLSVLLHAGVSVLVFLGLRRIQADSTTAWLAALLFAVHPIHTEAVAWISAFPDLQSSFFVLLGACCTCGPRTRPDGVAARWKPESPPAPCWACWQKKSPWRCR